MDKLPIEDIVNLLEVHNNERKLYGCIPLQWDSNLESIAQNWADHLAQIGHLEHSKTRYGENLYFTSNPKFKPTDAVRSWIDEKKYYNYKLNNWWPNAAHWSQCVWSSTRQIGVGITHIHGYTYVVANYSPAGNVSGQRPY